MGAVADRLYAFGWALMVPVVTLMVLDWCPSGAAWRRRCRPASAAPPTAWSPGLIAPLVMHSALALAATSFGHAEHRRGVVAVGQAAHARGAGAADRSLAGGANRRARQSAPQSAHAGLRRRPGRLPRHPQRLDCRAALACGDRGAPRRAGSGRASTRSRPASAWRSSSSATAWRGASRSCCTRRQQMLRHIALLVMLPVFPLFFAAYLPGRLPHCGQAPHAAGGQALGHRTPARQRHARRCAAVRRLSGLGGVSTASRSSAARPPEAHVAPAAPPSPYNDAARDRRRARGVRRHRPCGRIAG